MAALVMTGGCNGEEKEEPAPVTTPEPAPAPVTAPEPAPQETLEPTPEPELTTITEPESTFAQTQTTQEVPTTTDVKVLRVIDGDTIEIDLNGVTYSVRYIGIDTPELDDKRPEIYILAHEATMYNRELVEGKLVRLEKDISDVDKYGRLLRYVYVGDIFVNAELVQSGYAQAIPYPPDVKYQDLLLQLQEEAQEMSKGLWAASPTITPTPPTEASNIQITYIFYDGLVPRVESDEYVEITNLGEQPQDLAGWILTDISEGYPSLIFPSYILAPSNIIRFYTNENHPEWGGFSFEYSRAVWNNSEPDIAVLYDNYGNEVSRRSY